MKIAAIVPYPIYPPKMGGQKGVAFFYQFLSRLTPVIFFTVKANVSPADQSIDCRRIFNNSKFRYINPLYFFSIRKQIITEGITHLILEHPYFGWMGLLLKLTTKVNIVIHSHNIEALRFQSIGKWWWGILWHYEKHTHRMANLNFFITDEDRNFAVKKFGLRPEICHTITYGIDIPSPPGLAEKQMAASQLRDKYSIPQDAVIMLFNGTLDYGPNEEALNIILKEINPRLLKSSLSYRIIICGKALPDSFHSLKEYADKNIVYAGFVDDINIFFRGCDIFINPVIEGGGIKTKLVEALAYNMSAVSTVTGAFGIPAAITGGKLMTVKDKEWEDFAQKLIACTANENISPAFFNHFYWGNIASTAKELLEKAH